MKDTPKKKAVKKAAKKAPAIKKAAASPVSGKGANRARQAQMRSALKDARRALKGKPEEPLAVHDLMMLFVDKMEEHKRLFEEVWDAVAPERKTLLLMNGTTDKESPA